MSKLQIVKRNIRLQISFYIFISMILLFSNLLLSLKLFKSDVVTRLVPTIKSEQIISENFVSNEALEIRAKEFINILFSCNKYNFSIQKNKIISLVDNSSIKEFEDLIYKLSDDINSKNYRYIFTEKEYSHNNNKFKTYIVGNLETIMGGKIISLVSKKYEISFSNKGGVLLINSFKEEILEEQ